MKAAVLHELKKPMTIEDFDSRLASMIPARRRALWLLRLQKPRS